MRGDHVVFVSTDHGYVLKCTRCGGEQPVAMPVNVTFLNSMAKAYMQLHGRCKLTEKARAE